MKISFCTQIKNRAWQLRETLPENLALLEGTEHEWVILDVGSTDDIQEVIAPYLSHPNLVFIQRNMGPYRMASAMNLAMTCGMGDILVSLDCDNFIGQDWLEHLLLYPQHITHNWAGGVGDGTYGRISCPKDLWYQLGGFCEDYICGAHDKEFVDNNRKLVKTKQYLGRGAILNTKVESKAETSLSDWNWAEVTRDNAYRLWERRIQDIALPRSSIHQPVGHPTRLRQTKARRELVLKYTVAFSESFDFGEQGILPGLCGSTTRDNHSYLHECDYVVQPIWNQAGELSIRHYRDWDGRKYANVIPTGLILVPGHSYRIWQKFETGVIVTYIQEEQSDKAVSHQVNVPDRLCDGYEFTAVRLNHKTKQDDGQDCLTFSNISLL